MIPLDSPLCCLDVETTGTSPSVDRVVQIGVIKCYADGRRVEWESLVNPECHIPAEATECHGITDERVKDAPTFRGIAGVLHKSLAGCDVLGYNVGFDLRFLDAEFKRLGMPSLQPRIVDAMKIFHLYHPRNLAAAVERYLKRKMDGAHDALIDARYTLEVWEAQMQAHPDLPRTVELLHRQFFETPQPGHVDAEGKFAWRDGVAVINFGKNAGIRLDAVDRGWLNWVTASDFSEDVKQIVRSALRGDFPRKGE